MVGLIILSSHAETKSPIALMNRPKLSGFEPIEETHVSIIGLVFNARRGNFHNVWATLFEVHVAIEIESSVGKQCREKKKKGSESGKALMSDIDEKPQTYSPELPPGSLYPENFVQQAPSIEFLYLFVIFFFFTQKPFPDCNFSITRSRASPLRTIMQNGRSALFRSTRGRVIFSAARVQELYLYTANEWLGQNNVAQRRVSDTGRADSPPTI